jgi:Domain of unknown function (DUF4190)
MSPAQPADSEGSTDRSRPYPPGPPGTEPSPSDKYFQDLTYSRAKNALWLGLFSVLCCGLFAGIPAIWEGIHALRDIDASHGRLLGRGSAIVGIVLGVIGILLSIGAVTYETTQA